MKNTNSSMFSKFETAKIVGMNEITGGAETAYTTVYSGRGPGYDPSGSKVMVSETLCVRDDGAWTTFYETSNGQAWYGEWHNA